MQGADAVMLFQYCAYASCGVVRGLAGLERPGDAICIMSANNFTRPVDSSLLGLNVADAFIFFHPQLSAIFLL
jgi:hypothetical protein